MTKFQETLGEFFPRYGLQILGAIIILAVGFWVSRLVSKMVQQSLDKKDMEPPVRKLLVQFARLAVMILTFVLALDKFGVQVTPLIAGIGVAGVGIGLALQGLLGNLIAGFFIIFTKPFKVGEYIDMLGVHGTVKDIQLFTTILVHADRSRVLIPNRKIIGEILHNYGTVRLLEIQVGVGYETNLPRAIAIIREAMLQNPRVLKDPAPAVNVSSLGDSAIVLSATPFTTLVDSGPAKAELYLAIVDVLRREGISIPFPQREVKIVEGKFGAA